MKKGLVVMLAVSLITSTSLTFAQPKNVVEKPVHKVKAVKHINKVIKPVSKPVKKITKPVKSTSGGGADVVTSPTTKGPGGKGSGIKPSKGTGIMGITTNNMPYEVVNDISTLPADIQNNINSFKESRGYYLEKNGDNGYIFTIFSGQRNTGGYGIKVNSVKDVEGITTIMVEETAPAKEQIVNMMVTYPSVTLSMKNVNERIIVINTDGLEINSLSVK